MHAQPGAGEWGYEGDVGPERWGSLDPAYAACSQGSEQSPIDLTAPKRGAVPALEPSYSPSAVEVENTGHSIQWSFAPGSTLALDGEEFELQFHFHAPSEHELDGALLPLELHFVHQGAGERLAVLGVMVKEGGANPAYDALLEDLPRSPGETRPIAAEVDPLELLPPSPGSAERFSYDGSLTTPPCSEGVRWTVFAEPIELSARQIGALTGLYAGNNRPVQPLGGRELALGS